MKKMDFPVGQKVRGYGLLNEYGEFDFIPEQTGIRQGETKLLASTDDYTISKTKKKLIVHVRVTLSGDVIDVLKSYIKIMNNVLFKLREYDEF